MADNTDNLSLGNFSIQDTMEMGMGNQELLQGLFEPETASSSPDDVQPIIKDAEPATPPAKPAVPKGKEITPVDDDAEREAAGGSQDAGGPQRDPRGPQPAECLGQELRVGLDVAAAGFPADGRRDIL
jgi:hypothetical protein